MTNAAVRADGRLPARRAATDDLRAGKTVLVRQTWNVRALVVHVSGKGADVECDACSRGVGQWKYCVVPDDESALRTKSCANCLNSKQPCLFPRVPQEVAEPNHHAKPGNKPLPASDHEADVGWIQDYGPQEALAGPVGNASFVGFDPQLAVYDAEQGSNFQAEYLSEYDFGSSQVFDAQQDNNAPQSLLYEDQRGGLFTPWENDAQYPSPPPDCYDETKSSIHVGRLLAAIEQSRVDAKKAGRPKLDNKDHNKWMDQVGGMSAQERGRLDRELEWEMELIQCRRAGIKFLNNNELSKAHQPWV